MKFLSKPERQDDIKFVFAKWMPYKLRTSFIFIFIFLGILLQLFVNFWLGLAFIVFSTGLSLIKGYDAKFSLKRVKEDWAQVTPDEYKKIKQKEEQLKKWDIDAFDVSNPLGFGVLVAISIFVAFVFLVLKYAYPGSYSAGYLAIDSAFIFLPLWFSGTRDYLKQDKLVIKINILEQVINFLSSPSDIQALPMLATKEEAKGQKVPTDARLMVRFLNSPDSFMGMQVQICINDVQGTYYPYLYCVLLAKKDSGFFNVRKELSSRAPDFISFERTSSGGVDVLVIRQKTTKTSGYHTDMKKCILLVQTSINAAREFFLGKER